MSFRFFTVSQTCVFLLFECWRHVDSLEGKLWDMYISFQHRSALNVFSALDWNRSNSSPTQVMVTVLVDPQAVSAIQFDTWWNGLLEPSPLLVYLVIDREIIWSGRVTTAAGRLSPLCVWPSNHLPLLKWINDDRSDFLMFEFHRVFFMKMQTCWYLLQQVPNLPPALKHSSVHWSLCSIFRPLSLSTLCRIVPVFLWWKEIGLRFQKLAAKL